MKSALTIIGLVLSQLWLGCAALASPLDLLADVDAPIGLHTQYLYEDAHALTADDAYQAYASGRFQPVRSSMMNFGMWADPVWLVFIADNPTQTVLDRQVLVETSWIDQIDLYFLHEGALSERQRVGDTLTFAERPIKNRHFALPHTFEPGETVVLMRVVSVDPMALPIYVVTPAIAHERSLFDAYTYGLLYGAVLALLAYNFILFLKLKHARYALYALYLSVFIFMTVGYSGHGFQWLWPENPTLQRWLVLISMVAYGITGLLFASSFLETEKHFPRLHRVVLWGAVAFIGLECAAIAADSHAWAVFVAFVFALIFSLTMVALGTVSLLHGITFAKYFLIAALAAAVGAATTAVTVWGLVPYTVLGYRAVEIGMVIDAVLLALALADQFRVHQEQKNQAEHLARIDPLTGLNNRRGFYDLVAPAWSTGVRYKRAMAVIAFDLDHFKAFNDAYGHPMGDKVLVMVSEALKRAARAGDIAARWGGEEFLLFLPETTADEAVSFANRLRQEINAHAFDCQGQAVFVTASFGVSERQDDDVSVDDVIEAADHKLYSAKQTGRNRVCAA